MKTKKIVAYLLVIALVCVSVLSSNSITARAKVKSIKVKKKATVYVGKTKTIKVKVKTKGKTSKKFTVKVSKKKIVKVKVKKGKIKVKGLKPGKVKLTIKSKANKKKKKVVKLTVKYPKATMDLKQARKDALTLSFSRKVSLSASKITIQTKATKSGSYNKTLKIKELTTTTKKYYAIILTADSVIKNGEYIKVTVKGVNKKPLVKEIVAYSHAQKRFRTEVVMKKTTNKIDVKYAISDLVGGDHGKVTKVTGIPDGIDYSNQDGTINLKGKIKNTGIYTTTINLADEKSTQFMLRVVFVIGSKDKLTIYSPKRITCVYPEEENGYGFTDSDIYISGGSGSYNLSVINNGGVYYDEIYEIEGYYTWNLDVFKVGKFKGKFLVKDANDSSISAEATAEVEARKAVKITGKIKSLSGKDASAYVEATPKTWIDGADDCYDDYGDSGEYTIYALPGVYDIVASQNGAFSYCFNKNVKKSVSQNFILSVYVIKFKYNNPKIPEFYTWYLGEEDVGEGEEVYLRKGSYSLDSEDDCLPYHYVAKASFKVVKDMKVVPKVTVSNCKIINITGNTTVDIGEQRVYLKYVPKITAKYTIYSTAATGDPEIRIYDNKYKWIDYGFRCTDGYNFTMDINLTKGKTYYIALRDFNGDGHKTDVNFKTS